LVQTNYLLPRGALFDRLEGVCATIRISHASPCTWGYIPGSYTRHIVL